MKISTIRCEPVDIPLRMPFGYAMDSLERLQYCYVRVACSTDLGSIEGVGECSIAPDVTGETQESACSFFRMITPDLEGERVADLQDVKRLLERSAKTPHNESAKAGLDMALLDALGKAKRCPVHSLLGKQKHTAIPYQAVIAFSDLEHPDEIRQRIQEYMDRGVRHFKLKLGYSDAYDEAIVRLVREMDRDVQIAIDANQAWTRSQATALMERLERFRITWFEQPLEHTDWEGLMRLGKHHPVMADEAIHTYEDLVSYTAQYKLDFLNIKLAKCGGILQALRMVEYCKKHSIKAFIGSMVESNIGTAANLHLAAVTDFIQTDVGSFQYVDDHYTRGIDVEGPSVQVTRGPGLGVRIAGNR